VIFIFLLLTTAVFAYSVYRVVSPATMRSFYDLAITNTEMPLLFPRYMINTVLVTASVVLLQLWVATPAGYALAKISFPGSRFLNAAVEFGLLFGSLALFVGQYVVLNHLRLVNSFPALVLPLTATSLGVFLVREYVKKIPGEIIDTARIAGASHRRICNELVLPGIKPACVALVVFTINSAWRAGSMNFVYSPELRLLGDAGFEQAGLAAALAAIVLAVPLAVFTVYHGYISDALALSGLKQASC
jgi:ABC-type glycerol-3-phosphate transport system permease component